MIKDRAIVTPKTPKAREILTNHLNNKSEVRLEAYKMRSGIKRCFVSAIDNPDFWFWVDKDWDEDWDIYIINDDNTKFHTDIGRPI
jgi:hypothetical protein|tara:strand:+ start:15459 stop:15716 length:258 start_codon:yes stop_codon:yes gene_type:complete